MKKLVLLFAMVTMICGGITISYASESPWAESRRERRRAMERQKRREHELKMAEKGYQVRGYDRAKPKYIPRSAIDPKTGNPCLGNSSYVDIGNGYLSKDGRFIPKVIDPRR